MCPVRCLAASVNLTLVLFHARFQMFHASCFTWRGTTYVCAADWLSLRWQWRGSEGKTVAAAWKICTGELQYSCERQRLAVCSAVRTLFVSAVICTASWRLRRFSFGRTARRVSACSVALLAKFAEETSGASADVDQCCDEGMQHCP